MKFEISRSVLLNAIQSVASAASTTTKDTLPILQHILIRLTHEQLRMTATNLEIELSSVTGCIENGIQVSVIGELTVPARKFMDVVRAFPEETIKIELAKDNKLSIKCGRSRFTLSVLNAMDYPNSIEINPVDSITVHEGMFKKALNAVFHAAAVNDVRYYLNGVHLDFNKIHGLNIVATNGHRLSIENLAVDSKNDWNMIIPIGTIDKILKLLEDSEEQLKLLYMKNFFSFSKDNVMLKAKLVDGIFPDYQRVIPKDSQVTVIIDRESLLSVIKRVLCVMSDRNTPASFEFSQSMLIIYGKNDANEHADESIEISTSSDIKSPIIVGLNCRYIAEALSSIETELVKIGLNDSLSPCLIEPLDGCGKRVIMPTRL